MNAKTKTKQTLQQMHGEARLLLKSLTENAWIIKQKRSKKGTIFYETYIEKALTAGDFDYLVKVLPDFKITYYQAAKSAIDYVNTRNCENYIQIKQNLITIITGRGTGNPIYQSYYIDKLEYNMLRDLLGVYYGSLNVILTTEFHYNYIKNSKYYRNEKYN